MFCLTVDRRYPWTVSSWKQWVFLINCLVVWNVDLSDVLFPWQELSKNWTLSRIFQIFSKNTRFPGKTLRRKFVAHKISHKIVPYKISEKPRFPGKNCSYHNLDHFLIQIVITAIFSGKTGFLGNCVRDNFVGNFMGYKFPSKSFSGKSSFPGENLENPGKGQNKFKK